MQLHRPTQRRQFTTRPTPQLDPREELQVGPDTFEAACTLANISQQPPRAGFPCIAKKDGRPCINTGIIERGLGMRKPPWGLYCVEHVHDMSCGTVIPVTPSYYHTNPYACGMIPHPWYSDESHGTRTNKNH